MSTDLHRHIQQTKMSDTHQHLLSEQEWIQGKPDILTDLFEYLIRTDMVVAGAPQADIDALRDKENPDIARRFRAIEPVWNVSKFTGFGEAVRLAAKHLYGLDEITVKGLLSAQEKLAELHVEGRLRLLRDVANLDHVQIDNFRVSCEPDPSGPEFFLYDLSWLKFCNGKIDPDFLAEETGIQVQNLSTLDEAMASLFATHAPCAIAVKSQHAYNRSLQWTEREPADAEQALKRILANPSSASREDRLIVGDWCLARGVELSIEHNLPFKLHTGYHAGSGQMPIEGIRPGHLCSLLRRYPQARFVLMHIGYPYYDELLAVAKHYPNVWVDMCWAWTLNPRASTEFVRRFLHSVPVSKLFVYGGDTYWPTITVGYAIQARLRLERTLQSEIDDGELTESEAMQIATLFMQENQRQCFDLEGTRANILNTLNH